MTPQEHDMFDVIVELIAKNNADVISTRREVPLLKLTLLTSH